MLNLIWDIYIIYPLLMAQVSLQRLRSKSQKQQMTTKEKCRTIIQVKGQLSLFSSRMWSESLPINLVLEPTSSHIWVIPSELSCLKNTIHNSLKEEDPPIGISNSNRVLSTLVKAHAKCQEALGRKRLITTITTSLKSIYQDHSLAIKGNLLSHLEPKDMPIIFFFLTLYTVLPSWLHIIIFFHTFFLLVCKSMARLEQEFFIKHQCLIQLAFCYF